MKRLLLLLLVAACRAAEPAAGQPAQSEPPAAGAEPRDDRGDWPRVLRFGINPHVNAKLRDNSYDGMARYLEARLGLPVEIVKADGYQDLAAKLLAGEVDVADVSPFNYVMIKERDPGVTLLARQIAAGSNTYSAYVVVRDDSGLASLADLKGKSFGFVDPRSASGYLFPLKNLLDAGIDPERDLSAISYLGTHDKVISAVLSGAVDAGAIWSGAIGQARSLNPDAAALRVISKTDRIPYDADVARSGLPASLKDAVSKALHSLSTSTEEGRLALAALPTQINGFVPGDDADYDVIREVARRVRERLGDAPLAASPTIR